ARGLRAADSARIDGAHQKAIRARRQIRVVDCALIGWRAPVMVHALQFVLIAEQSRAGNAQAGEINLQIALCGAQLQSCDSESAEFAERLLDAGNAQTFNPDGWRRRYRLRSGIKPRQTTEGAEPEAAFPVAVGGSHKISGQAIG